MQWKMRTGARDKEMKIREISSKYNMMHRDQGTGKTINIFLLIKIMPTRNVKLTTLIR